MSFGKLVCAVFPFGESDSVIKEQVNSNSTIGYDQYLLLQRILGPDRAELFDMEKTYSNNDVLIIISTIWIFPIEKLMKFRKVIYFFDDNSVSKASSEKYAAYLNFVGLVLHPDPKEVAELREFWQKPTYYIPWSSPHLPPASVVKTPKPSFFVDMDHRTFARDTVGLGFDFIKFMQHNDFEFYFPEQFADRVPADCSAQIHAVPRMSHELFLRFIQNKTFYVSGICGSYEYVTMESALVGCGLISLFSSVRQVHRDRPLYLDYKGQPSFMEEIQDSIKQFDENRIISAARRLYPHDAVGRIPELISRHFNT